MRGENFKRAYFYISRSRNPTWCKWLGADATKSTTDCDISRGGDIEGICHRDVLRFNKQSLAFYSEVLPYFYGYIEANIPMKKEYTLLDVGARTGTGSNFIGQMFADTDWGYKLKLTVDTTDTSRDWNDYIKLMPYINRSYNTDIFDMKEKTYDICFCSHTIEHVDNPVDFVRQLKKIAKQFAFITCPFGEVNPIPGHHTITKEIVEECNPKYVTTYKSVNRWR
ncbi:MAG: hypothetical protein J1D88_09330 [Treponema sp.]|nr:hypothetical protein [Treponema sp.]